MQLQSGSGKTPIAESSQSVDHQSHAGSYWQGVTMKR